jgi:hypothetical protein
MFKNRDIDQFKVLGMPTPIPETFPQFHPIATGRCKTGVGDILINPIPLREMIITPNDIVSDRI